MLSSTGPNSEAPSRALEEFVSSLLEVNPLHYHDLLHPFGPTIKVTDRITLEIHLVGFSANLQPRFDDLVRRVYHYIAHFVLPSDDRPTTRDAYEWSLAIDRARETIRRYGTSGAFGELLLYFLLEAVTRAPQVACKYYYKQNRRTEALGADAVHVKWDETEKVLDVFLGESKLYPRFSDACTKAFRSIKAYHEKGDDRFEIRLLRRTFKHGPEARAALDRYLKHDASDMHRLNHAVLLGFESPVYKSAFAGTLENVRAHVLSELTPFVPKFEEAIRTGAADVARDGLRFLVFLVPFKDIDEVRTLLTAQLKGEV